MSQPSNCTLLSEKVDLLSDVVVVVADVDMELVNILLFIVRPLIKFLLIIVVFFSLFSNLSDLFSDVVVSDFCHWARRCIPWTFQCPECHLCKNLWIRFRSRGREFSWNSFAYLRLVTALAAPALSIQLFGWSGAWLSSLREECWGGSWFAAAILRKAWFCGLERLKIIYLQP